MTGRRLAGLAALAALLGAAGAAAQAPPRLVLLLVVDQLRPEALDPARPGGLGRLAREGRVFVDALLDHAATETCPGHAAIATGRHPGRVGIPGNQWVDAARGALVWCVEDPAADAHTFGTRLGRSPRLLRTDALGDWLRAARPESRVHAVSGKDRGAIPLGGRRPAGAFWLEPEALGFTTSRYYAARLPAWLERFNAVALWEGLPARWQHADGSSANGARPDDSPGEAPLFGRTSGHPVLGLDRRQTLETLSFTPFLDRATLDLARVLVAEEALGADATPDLLALSLSATDRVGHLYGPGSQEVHDLLQRLDAWLGELLEFLEARTAGGGLLVALTSDHGVLELPEWGAATGGGECPVPGGRVDARALGARLEQRLAERFGEPGLKHATWMLQAGFELSVNRPLAAARGVDAARVAQAAGEILTAEPGVARTWSVEERRAGRGPTPFAPLYQRAFDPERSGDLAVQPVRDCLLSPFPTGTSHGSPYLYDREIPLVFWGAGVRPGRVRGRASAVDVAPTLAARLAVPAPPDLDGRVLDLGAHP